MSDKYITMKITQSVKAKLDEYAKARGLSLSAAVNSLLEKAAEEDKLGELLAEIRRQNALLEEQVELLKKNNHLLEALIAAISAASKVAVAAPPQPEEEKEESEEELPSFVRGNPWLKVIRDMGR